MTQIFLHTKITQLWRQCDQLLRFLPEEADDLSVGKRIHGRHIGEILYSLTLMYRQF